jgi:hypothetical protein
MRFIKYRIFFLGLSIVSCSEEQKGNIDKSPVEYSFFIAGHTYGAPGIDNEGVHPPFKNKFDFIKNDKHLGFGVFTGDIVPFGTVTNWDEIDQDIDDLGLPVYFAAGNHDVTDRALFESRYGQTYYSFVDHSDLFIVLDPNLDEWNISGDQLEFLENVLNTEAQNVNNIFVFFHQLLWWEPDNIFQNVALNSFVGRAENINFSTEIAPLFASLTNPVHMLAGDVGAFSTGSEFMFHQFNNITLIASGMGGGIRDNFIIVDVHEDSSVSFRLIALNGDNVNALGELEDYELP